ncbi:MAG: mannonate dehydratase [Bacteroides sp. SM23_62_1]|nr:MAG: mannonate dehydratase [Bacteroides sp. SM23_62_1]
MNILRKSTVFLIVLLNIQVGICQNQIPRLQKKGNRTQLIVEGNPFIILGGELGNSSATTIENMHFIWPKLKAMNLNTVLIPVYWELIESEEAKFDFSLVEQIITEARNNKLKLVFLWFASWKNSMSCYAPGWIKLNQERFPRIKDDKNRSHEILTPFSENNLMADLNAFEKLMSFIKDFDETNQTVIMIQVENEIGMLPTARDYHPLANEAFKKNVPGELIKYMQQNRNKLVPEFLDIWGKNGFKTSGNWEEIFGKGTHTDEIFMAWYYSKYANRIIEAGKKIYPLPMFVNAALNRPNREPGSGYPSAGPLPHLMDVWKAAGPSIDFLAPDIYFPAFKHWSDLYTRQGDPLFIPEHRFDNTAAYKSLYAIGHYGALGFAPFSIESTDEPENEPLGKVYHLLAQLSPIISANQGQGKPEGVLFDKENRETIIQMGKYEFTFRHDYTLGWSPGANADEWPMTGAIIIQTGEDEFYIAGSGVVVTFKHTDDDSVNTGILKVDEGRFENNDWIILRHLNGDQTHQGRHLRIPEGDYSIQRLKLYTYK